MLLVDILLVKSEAEQKFLSLYHNNYNIYNMDSTK